MAFPRGEDGVLYAKGQVPLFPQLWSAGLVRRYWLVNLIFPP